jgi:hypothetical protein
MPVSETAQKFIEELIAAVGEPAAIQLLEEASAFRNLRKLYLSGDPNAMDLIVGTIAGWEESDEVPLFVHTFVPYMREMSIFKPAEAVAEMQRGTPLAKQISESVTLLRNLAGGKLAVQLQTPVKKVN